MNQANQNLLHPSRQVGADLAAWRKVGGGEGLLAALADPQSIVSKLQDANLCGMGGAGFPTWRKGEAAVAAQSKHGDKYVVCNANEDEPGTFKDRVLLAKTPHQVIEGVLIAAVACRANKAIMYVNPHQTESVAAIVPAIEQWKKSDLFIRIENYLGKPLDLKLVETSGRYIGGEETTASSWLGGGVPVRGGLLSVVITFDTCVSTAYNSGFQKILRRPAARNSLLQNSFFSDGLPSSIPITTTSIQNRRLCTFQNYKPNISPNYWKWPSSTVSKMPTACANKTSCLPLCAR